MDFVDYNVKTVSSYSCTCVGSREEENRRDKTLEIHDPCLMCFRYFKDLPQSFLRAEREKTLKGLSVGKFCGKHSNFIH